MSGRVLFYVQHLLGVGHLKRAEILAGAMAAAGLDVTVAYGGLPFPEVPFNGLKVAQLPAATIANEDFVTLLGASGSTVDETWIAVRRARLLDLYRSIEPDVVLLELFPFGRRQFRFELLPLLEAIHATAERPRVAASVRDILVARKPERAAETVETLRRYFDAVLVHGDPALIPFERTFTAADQISDLIRYTGYVCAAGRATEKSDADDEVIVSAGGGAVGGPLLFAAMTARPMTPLAGHRWRFLAGPNLPDAEYRRLSATADNRTVVERFRPDFASRLRAAALSISQAGYNTTMDILASGVRAVVVPYETRGETEQRLRAEILAGKGLLTLVPEAELTPVRLAQAISLALQSPRRTLDVNLAGAENAARLVRDLAAQRRHLGG
ncbi:MAG: glycosyltransferase family protein [Propylenella sp.]